MSSRITGPKVSIADPPSPTSGVAEIRTIEDAMQPLTEPQQKIHSTMPMEEEIRYLRWMLDEERKVASELRAQLLEREQSEGHLRQSLAEAYQTLAATVRQVSGISPLAGQDALAVSPSGLDLSPQGSSTPRAQAMPCQQPSPLESESTDASPDGSGAGPVAAVPEAPAAQALAGSASHPAHCHEHDVAGLGPRIPMGPMPASTAAATDLPWFSRGDAMARDAMAQGCDTGTTSLIADQEVPAGVEPDIEAAAKVASHIVGTAWEKAFQKLWRKWSEEGKGRAA